MWSRAQLKDRARIAFKRNYWKVVLVSALIILFTGAGGSTYSSTSSTNYTDVEENGDYNSSTDLDDNYEDDFNAFFGGEFSLDSDASAAAIAGFLVGVLIVFMIVFVLIMAAVLVLQAFIFNPLDVGAKRFFFKNLNEKANVKEIAFAYDNNYLNVVKTLFFRDLYTFLWSLLFIIPGIVKSYEYRMMPYLLAENPAMSKEQAFAISKQMMDGQKWEAFVLDLSFLGWQILSAFTMGLLAIFYVTPYINMTNAALYESLCYQRQWTTYNQPEMAPVNNDTKES